MSRERRRRIAQFLLSAEFSPEAAGGFAVQHGSEELVGDPGPEVGVGVPPHGSERRPIEIEELRLEAAKFVDVYARRAVPLQHPMDGGENRRPFRVALLEYGGITPEKIGDPAHLIRAG
jgi:hypothetical protein